MFLSLLTITPASFPYAFISFAFDKDNISKRPFLTTQGARDARPTHGIRLGSVFRMSMR